MLGSFVRTITIIILIITMMLMLLGNLIKGLIPSKPDETTTTTAVTQPATVPTTAPTTKPTTQPTTEPVTEPITDPVTETTTSKETTTEGGVLIRAIEKLPVTLIEGSGADIIRGADASADGGFVICGTSTSTDGWFADVSKGALNSTYSFVAKLNKNGAAIWKQQYTQQGETVVLSDIATLSDGGILAVGYAYRSNSYDSSATTAALAIKYTASGNIEWVKRYSGSGHSLFNGVSASLDGFAVSGNTTSLDGDFIGNRAEPSENFPSVSKRTSGFIFSLDGNGNVKWKEFFCGSRGSSMGGVSCDGDGNVFAACMTSSTDGDFARFDSLIGGYNDSIAYKFSPDGKLLWGYCVATSGIDKFGVIEADGEGGCLLGGSYELRGIPAPDGTLTGISYCGGKTDALVIRIDGSGKEQWMRAVSGYYEDQITDIRRTEGGFVVTGYTKSGDREFNTVGNLGEFDAFADFLTPGGNRAAIATQAGSDNDMANCVAISGGIVRVFGQTASSNGSFSDAASASSDKFSGYSAGYALTVK